MSLPLYRCILLSRNNQPFLHVQLLGKLPAPRHQSRSDRMIGYGERKWSELEHAKGFIKRTVYRIGSYLVDKIPMEEAMLWRLYALQRSHLEELEVYTESLPVSTQSISSHLRDLERKHRRWSWIHGLGLIPVTILTVLPGVKLVWAWLAFRCITHYRASEGARWFSTLLHRNHIKFIATEDASSSFTDLDNNKDKA